MNDGNRVTAEKGAVILINLIDNWLSEPGAQFVGGKDAEYSMIDVFATVFLVRL